jgi:hypothetical protein
MRKLFFIIFIPIACYGASGPKYVHKDPVEQMEWQNIYSILAESKNTSKISFGAGTPTSTPGKVGDIYISTTTQKVYISTAAATSGSWVIVN